MNVKATLELFKGVLSEDDSTSVDFTNGIIYTNGSSWAAHECQKFLITQNQLNRSFHKQWKTVIDTDRETLLIEQLKHYMSTYGTDMLGEVYEPNEIVGIPVNIKFQIVKGLTKEELKSKLEGLLSSGIAMSLETINNVVSVAKDLGLDLNKLTKLSKNKEFVSMMVLEGYYTPTDPETVLRTAVLASTGNSLLIKNSETLTQIKESDFNPEKLFTTIGEKKMAEIFNRFKPIFLAYKKFCPKVINKISKESKNNHKPLPVNVLNVVTSQEIPKDYDLSTANLFTLLRAYNAVCVYTGGKKAVAYKIRNGKGWVENKEVSRDEKVLSYNKILLLNEIRNRLNLKNQKVYIPEGITYTLPVSEKKMFGGIPYGSSVEGNNLAVGIYWENEWGATDLDLSGVSLGSKVGWNSSYNSNGLIYSGDMSNAVKGATEYLHCKEGTYEPTLVMNNVFSGESDCKYRIVVGKGVDITRDYMMSKDNLVFFCDTKSVSRNTYLGLMAQNSEGISKFTLTNIATGNARVSSENEVSKAARVALLEELEKLPTLNDLIKDYLTKDKNRATVDLSPDALGKDSLLSLFKV